MMTHFSVIRNRARAYALIRRNPSQCVIRHKLPPSVFLGRLGAASGFQAHACEDEPSGAEHCAFMTAIRQAAP